MAKKRLSYTIAAPFAILLLFTSPACQGQRVNPKLYQGMRWRMIGPFRGGRTLTAVGVPGEPNTYYFGAVAGGIWKTTNGGNTWSPIFDQQPIASIGALALAPSNPNVIYVGTGEADMRSDISFGNGVYKSVDTGRSWTHLGLADTRHIGRILVDPRNSEVVLVAALGHAYGPNAERGVFRSADGGRSWQRVLYKDENTGAIDLAADPDAPNIIYAALWNARRTPWSQYPPVSGPGSALYRSSDGGLTWAPVRDHGLPAGEWGRIGIAFGKGKGLKRIYLLIDAAEGGVFRSDDGGNHWERVGTDQRIRERAWYFSGITVDPQDPDVVYVPSVALYRSTDGGKTFDAFKGAPGGDDYHALWIDPHDSNRMILASDQGAAISVDGGATWSSWYNQPTAQLYHVATDNQFPYFVYGAQQDSGTVATTSRSDYGSITFRDWYSIGAGEAGEIAPDPSDPNVVYGGDTKGELFRFDKRTGQSHDISPAVGQSFELAMPKQQLRFTWTSPLVFSPFDPHVAYFGAQYVLKTIDRGINWQAISPDLTGAAEQLPAETAPTPATATQLGYGVIYSIASSPVRDGQIWSGSDTGRIYLTRNEGKTWANVTPGGLGDWSKVSSLDASPFDAGTAYAAIDRHRLDDYAPYIYRTHDVGQTWTKMSEGIAAPSYVHVVREDPVRQKLLYAGTETGVYISFDDGDHWQPLQLNLPVVPVHDLVVKDDDLVIATHGRSFWILDDLTPLRQANPQVAASEAHLFRPQPAMRVRSNVNRDTPLPAEVPAGENPPAGAILDYYIGNEPVQDITLEIIDERGGVVRRFSSGDRYHPPEIPPRFTSAWLRPEEDLLKTPGMHRFVWDLRYSNPGMIEPEYSSAVAFGQNTPPIAQGPLVLPGEYQVRLTVAGRGLSEPLTVRMDPRVRASVADLAGQFDLEGQISNAMAEVYHAYEQVREVQGQLERFKAATAASPSLRAASEALNRKLGEFIGKEELPGMLANKQIELPTLRMLDRKLAATWAAADSADAQPTSQVKKAFQQARQELEVQLRAWKELQQKDIAACNATADSAGVSPIVVPQ